MRVEPANGEGNEVLLARAENGSRGIEIGRAWEMDQSDHTDDSGVPRCNDDVD